MKKSILIVLSLTLLISCRKTITTNGGQWTLNSLTYKATQAYYVQRGLVATTGTGIPTGSFTIWFRDTVQKNFDSITGTSWPPRYPSYTLSTSFPPDTGYAYIQLTDSSLFNSYTITGSTTPKITIAFNKDSSLITVTIPPVMVSNTNGTWTEHPSLYPLVIGKPTGTISSLVSGTIIQTQ